MKILRYVNIQTGESDTVRAYDSDKRAKEDFQLVTLIPSPIKWYLSDAEYIKEDKKAKEDILPYDLTAEKEHILTENGYTLFKGKQ